MKRSEKIAEDAIVAALVDIHRRQQARTTNRRSSEYERLVAHFEGRAERLRGEQVATRELVERLLVGTRRLPATVHRELEIQGPAGRVAAGRLRIRNRASSARRFELTVGDAISKGRTPPARLDPQHGILAVDAATWVRVECSLDGFAPGESATLPIQCYWEGGVDRIWLTVTTDPEGV